VDVESLYSLQPSDFDVPESEARREYEKFLLKYPKTSSLDPAEARERFHIFWQNLRRILFYNHIEQGSAVYKVNEFADMSEEEFGEKYLGFSYDGKRKEKKRFSRGTKLRHIPESFDWTEKGAVTPVKNQGMCGSCWAFSTTGNIEGTWFLATGELVELSEQELVDCDQVDQGCNGGLMDNAFDEIIRLGGLETEKEYPYDAHVESCEFERDLAQVYINSSMDIGEDEDEIAEALIEHGPLAIALNAFGMQFYHSGVSHPLSFLCSPEGLDHGVLMVGFGVEKKTSWRHRHPRPYWKIKNSWGPSWGENGYYRIYRGKGVCGVNKYVTTSIVDLPKTTTTATTTSTTTTSSTTTSSTTTQTTTTQTTTTRKSEDAN